MGRTSAAFGIVAVLAALLLMPARTTVAEGELKVSVVGEVQNSAYPNLNAVVSVVDASTGRPATDLGPASFAISDDAGVARVSDVQPTSTTDQPGAYVLLIDTSKYIQPYLPQILENARTFVSKLGSNDVVRVVKFNAGADERSTNWVGRDDPNLAAQLNDLTVTNEDAHVADSLVSASAIASSPPTGYLRHAVVAFIGLDGKRTEPNLKVSTINAQLHSTFFTLGFGQAPAGDVSLPFFLEDLSKYTGGAYWPVGAPNFPADPWGSLLGVTQRAWKVTFRADGQPDGRQHSLSLQVHDSLQRSGTTAAKYVSGRLGQVNPIQFNGIKDQDNVSSDRDIEVSATGSRNWTSLKIELFRDCDPGKCDPVATAQDQSLKWKIQVAPLGQGAHRLVARAVASDGKQEFTDTRTLRFERTGTTFNLGAVALLAGVAAVAIAATLLLIRRKSTRV